MQQLILQRRWNPPDDADLYYFRGNAYNKNNEFQKAADDYVRALGIKSEYSEAQESIIKAEHNIEIAEVKKEEENKSITESTEIKKRRKIRK
jgi:tetratricopeptide (TPR) repeat protein